MGKKKQIPYNRPSEIFTVSSHRFYRCLLPVVVTCKRRVGATRNRSLWDRNEGNSGIKMLITTNDRDTQLSCLYICAVISRLVAFRRQQKQQQLRH